MLTLPAVEPLSPSEAARAAGVPMEWLLRALRNDAIPHDSCFGRPVILSSDVDVIAAKYAERAERLAAMRAYHRRKRDS